MLVDRLTRLIPDRGRHSPVEARHLLKLRSEHRCVVEQAVSLVHFYLVLSLHTRANRAVNRVGQTAEHLRSLLNLAVSAYHCYDRKHTGNLIEDDHGGNDTIVALSGLYVELILQEEAC